MCREQQLSKKRWEVKRWTIISLYRDRRQVNGEFMAVAEGGQREKAIRKAGHKEGCAVPYIRFFFKMGVLKRRV
jgi:hypothetical protein